MTKVALHPHMREAKPDSTHGEPPNRAGRTKSMPKYTQPAKPNRKPLTTPHPPTSVGVRDGPSPRLTDGPPIGGVRLEICRLRSLEFLTLDPFWTTAILSLQCVVLHGSKCESAMTTISRMSKSQLTFLGKLGVLKLLQANMHLSNKTSIGTSRQVYASLV